MLHLVLLSTPAFQYEQIVMAKLGGANTGKKMNWEEAASYLSQHSTRYILKEAGVADATVDEALQIILGSAPSISMSAATVTSWYDAGERLESVAAAPAFTPPAKVGSGWGLMGDRPVPSHRMLGTMAKKPPRAMYKAPTGWGIVPLKPEPKGVESWYDAGARLSSDFSAASPVGWGIVPLGMLIKDEASLQTKAVELADRLASNALETNKLFLNSIAARAEIGEVNSKLALIAEVKAEAAAAAAAAAAAKAAAPKAKAVTKRGASEGDEPNLGVFGGIAAAIAAVGAYVMQQGASVPVDPSAVIATTAATGVLS